MVGKSLGLSCLYGLGQKLIAADAGIVPRQPELLYIVGCGAGSHAKYHVPYLHLRPESPCSSYPDQVCLLLE